MASLYRDKAVWPPQVDRRRDLHAAHARQGVLFENHPQDVFIVAVVEGQLLIA
jgi:hypothetical protein